MSSNIGIRVREITVDRKKKQFCLFSPEGGKSLWAWGHFGPLRLPDHLLRQNDKAESSDSGKEGPSAFFLPDQSAVSSSLPSEADAPTAELLFTGDLLFHGDLLKADARDILTLCSPILHQADLVCGNLEGPLTKKEISGNFPRYRYPARLAEELSAAGFDLLQCANNHLLDAGEEGLLQTLNSLEAANIVPLGLRRSEEEAPFQLLDIRGMRIGICAFSYENPPAGRQNFPSLNGLPVPSKWQKRIDSFPYLGIDKTSWQRGCKAMKERVLKMKEAGAELIIFCLHWGQEYALVPEKKQEELAQFLADAGVDLIIGSHPHVPQPLRALPSSDGRTVCYCYYSLGNFVSAQRPGPSGSYPLLEAGLIARLRLCRKEGRVCICEAAYLPLRMLQTDSSPLLLPLQDLDRASYASLQRKYGFAPAWEELEEFAAEIRHIVGPSLR